MLLNRKIELEQEEKDEIEAILTRPAYAATIEQRILNLFTKKIQEAFDFGYSEGRKSNE